MSLLLVAALILGALPGTAFAAENNEAETVEAHIEHLYEILPEGTDIVYKDGAYHIAITDANASYSALFAENGVQMNNAGARTTNVYSPGGGTYTHFGSAPVVGMDWPYYQSYLPEKETLVLLNSLLDENIWVTISTMVAEKVAEELIAAALLAKYGIDISGPYGQAFVLMANITITVLRRLNVESLKIARNASNENKVSITYFTSMSGRYYVYQAWEGNYCPSAYGASATWSFTIQLM